MNEYLKDTLEDGEKVLWEGKAEPFKIMDEPYKTDTLIRLVGLGGLYLLAIIGYLYQALSRGDGLSSVFVLVAILTIFVGLVIQVPFSDQKVIKRSNYILTDRRAIIADRSNMRSLYLNANTPCKILHLGNGTDILCFGDACNVKPTATRKAATVGIAGEMGSKDLTGLAFYGIKDARKVCKDYTACHVA
jgi:hypothetical protein